MRVADLSEDDIIRVDPLTQEPCAAGVAVTTPLRTGLDVVRDVGRSRSSALIPLCGAMRAHLRLHIAATGANDGAITELARDAALRDDVRARLRRVASVVNSHGMKWFYDVLPDVEPLVETALEGLAWALLTDSLLPRPRPQEWVRGASGRKYRVDFLIGDRVVLEADGAVKYADQTPWQEKTRQSDLEAAGYWVVRCTWEELIRRPHEILARIALALSRCG
jgi:very-short-patch-repair endonuclease